MKRYVKRCMQIGPKANVIRESFENMRGRLVSTGSEVLDDVASDDAYSESVMAALNGSDKLLESNNPNDPERDSAFWDGSKEPTFEERINANYRHTFLEGDQPWELSGGVSDAGGLRMDDLRGEGGVASKSPTTSDGRKAGGQAAGYHASQRGGGVVKKGTKPVDGRAGEGSTSGSAGGSTRMDSKQGGGGVQKPGVSSTDGRSSSKKATTATESTKGAGDTSGGNPALTKGGYSSVSLSMGDDFQGTGKGGVVPKSLTSGDGASGGGAPSAKKYEASGGPAGVGHDMSEHQGGDGVESDSLDADTHKGQGKVKSDGGLKGARRRWSCRVYYS
jgi:hypothetical protein